MNDTATHITLDVLADYFAELLDDRQEETVELHIADCDRCAETARWVHSLPMPSLDGWTARSHGQAALRPVLATALAQAESVTSGLKERLGRWREHLASETEGALHLIKEASGALSRGLDVLMPPPGWQHAARPIPIGGGGRMSLAGDDPMDERPPEAETSPTVRVLERGIGIEVRVENVDEGERPRLVALIPTREGGQPTVKELRPAPDAPRTLIARFMKDDDDFVIALEPWFS